MTSITFKPEYRRKARTIIAVLLFPIVVLLVVIFFQPHMWFAYGFLILLFLFLLWVNMFERIREIRFDEKITVYYLIRKTKSYDYADVRQIEKSHVTMQNGWIKFGVTSYEPFAFMNKTEINTIFSTLLEAGLISRNHLWTNEEIRAKYNKGVLDVVIITVVAVVLWLTLHFFNVLTFGELSYPALLLSWLLVWPFVHFIRRKA